MTSRLNDLHRSRLEAIATEAGGIADNASRIAAMAGEVLDTGGTLSVQPQVAYMVSALMRLVKDIGVLEQLQGEGVEQRPKMMARAR